MAKSNAKRQADYRARHLHDVDGKGERLNMVIDLTTKRALERLAKCYGVTQRQMLERLVDDAERAVLDKISLPAYSGYYDGQLKLDATNAKP
ncbi:MAG: hypothetical protein ACYCY8_13225 [Burkholderiales bacterium]